VATRIRSGYLRRRRQTTPLPPWDTANGFLKRETYRLVRHFDLNGHGDAIQALVRHYGREPRSPTYSQNKFHWGFLAIQGEQDAFLRSPQRRLFAAELLYAERHDVPELFLLGFIYQLGAQESIFERIERPGAARMVRWIGAS
jgi:hypothetical protein